MGVENIVAGTCAIGTSSPVAGINESSIVGTLAADVEAGAVTITVTVSGDEPDPGDLILIDADGSNPEVGICKTNDDGASPSTITLTQELRYRHVSGQDVDELTSTDFGLTTEDGIVMGESKDFAEIFSDQTLVMTQRNLSRVTRMITATLQEVSLANQIIAHDLESAVVGTYPAEQTLIMQYRKGEPKRWGITITGPAAKSRFFRYTCLGYFIESGDETRQKAGEVQMPVTIAEIGGATNDTFGVYSENTTTY